MFRSLALAMALTVPTVGSAEDGFGKARWGIALSELKRLYPKAEQAGDQWVVRSPVAERPAVTTFSFHQGKLYRAYVVFTVGAFKEGVMVASCDPGEYASLKALLVEKYGAPKTERQDWAMPTAPGSNKPLPRAKPEEWLIASFESKDTNVALGCNVSGLTLLYESKALSTSEAQTRKKSQLGDL